jgi:hypothetical protein
MSNQEEPINPFDPESLRADPGDGNIPPNVSCTT